MKDENKMTVALVPDPLAGVPITGNPEVDSLAEINAMTAAFPDHPKAGYFKGKEKTEDARRKNAMESEFYLCVVFQNREQKDAFLKGAGLEGYGDKYLDGVKVAAKMGVAIPETLVRFQGEKHDKAMTLNFEPIELPNGGEKQ